MLTTECKYYETYSATIQSPVCSHIVPISTLSIWPAQAHVYKRSLPSATRLASLGIGELQLTSLICIWLETVEVALPNFTQSITVLTATCTYMGQTVWLKRDSERGVHSPIVRDRREVSHIQCTYLSRSDDITPRHCWCVETLRPCSFRLDCAWHYKTWE